MSVPGEDAAVPLSLALSPPRAHGEAPARGRLRSVPEDFVVEEDLGFEPDGAGAHVLLHVRKRGANTEWVARELARQGGCRVGDVGYAGLKDRHAVALQWFSVPAGRRVPGDWVGAQGEGYEVLAAHAHRRKLPRGALAGNRFRIRVRELAADRAALAIRLDAIASRGVPNYFGEQRFGRAGANLRWLEQPGAQPAAGLKRHERSLLISSARSVIFNALLARRVLDGSWERLEVGDIAILDGRGSVFGVSELTPELIERCARLEVHPTGPLWGQGEPPSASRALERERLVAAQLGGACDAVVAQGMRQERRSLRLSVRELQWRFVADDLEVQFRLTRGSYATVVLREVLQDPTG
jgi:tRNA pseudouridine13 synthase